MNKYKSLYLLLILAWLQPCQAEGFSEAQIKSAYVLNFIKFAEWPAHAVWVNDQITLCVIGKSVLGGVLGELDGRIAAGRELHVIQLATAEHGMDGCNVVFIGESEQRQVGTIIETLGAASTLTISDIDNFARNGGAIGLGFRDNKIIFEVNLAPMRKANIRLPSQLLNLATRVLGR